MASTGALAGAAGEAKVPHMAAPVMRPLGVTFRVCRLGRMMPHAWDPRPPCSVMGTA